MRSLSRHEIFAYAVASVCIVVLVINLNLNSTNLVPVNPQILNDERLVECNKALHDSKQTIQKIGKDKFSDKATSTVPTPAPVTSHVPVAPPVPVADLLLNFNDQFRGGGMSFDEKQLVAETYNNAKFVFEWGIGSSSLIADHLGVMKLTGIDSSSEYTQSLDRKIRMGSGRKGYKFKYVDIGPIKGFGIPSDESARDQWPDYSLAVDDEEPADVYLVDGRFRLACACRALLHGRPDSKILIHDFILDEVRGHYQDVLQFADKLAQVGKLAVLQRSPNAKDENIRAIWEANKYNYMR